MPKVRKHKRKVPITIPEPSFKQSTVSASSSNPSSTRTLIRRFHVLIKRKAQLENAIKDEKTSSGVNELKKALMEVEREMEELGGLSTYQRMSSIGQGNDRGGGTEKVLIEWLKELGMSSSTQNKTRLRLLEVGALKPDNYAACSAWIQNTPIDLRSLHPSIIEQDFLLMDEVDHREKWDVISLSLVVNFVPDVKDRGRMLNLAHAMLCPNGLLFLALPLPCIMNSRYLTPEHFDGLTNVIGFSIIRKRWKEGGKMAYWLLRKSLADTTTGRSARAPYQKKTILRQGRRNNFAILL
ncbi:hypothetical protein AcW1_005562 [Taiwanofungus camphoratus]|nr:hypothetical protein AcV5_005886 [Antrodia cinnamomea]KAI0957043.1 hypothetical protein AcW1_005562 [Antrodia cinnamomea]